LNHPWIRESEEETTAAADAPPLATPLAVRQKTSGPTPLDQLAYLDDTPGSTRRMDFRSPGAVNLREVFDVGYAVHRQEEEGKRRKNFKQGYRGSNAMNSLNPLNEDDDDYDEDGADEMIVESDGQDVNPPSKLPKSSATDVSNVEQKMRTTTLSAAAQARQRDGGKPAQAKGYGQHSPAVAAAAKKAAAQRQRGPFELSLDHATILEHRRAKNKGSSLREQMVVE
jgi:serine/threonine-protein kinase RCK2